MASSFPHNWVEIRTVPVTAVQHEDGGVAFYASDEAIEIAEETKELKYLCLDCDANPSTPGVLDTDCSGAPGADQQ